MEKDKDNIWQDNKRNIFNPEEDSNRTARH
jgi:hypothetical protein